MINKLPTFVRIVLERYRSGRELTDDYSKYKALESVYAATTKYVGTTFALIAADQDPDLRALAWNKICNSSSLGGWLDAADDVCTRAPYLPKDVKIYCDEYSNYKKHPSRDRLDQIAANLNVVVDELTKAGYCLDRAQSLNIIRALRCVVAIRNKCAHGALDSPFFSRIEGDLYKALKLILHLIPFSKFIFWGQYGSNALKFVESPAMRHNRTRDARFWVESDLLSGRFTKCIPFLVYREESRNVYFLNDRVTADNPTAEFIDYESGGVIYRDIECYRPTAQLHSGTIRPRNYSQHLAVLSGSLTWREVPLTRAKADASTNEVGVYVFTAEVALGGRPIEVILYVGKTVNLAERLKAYLRILKGYDDSRPEITYMFTVYTESLRLLFASMPVDRIASVERAIYETTMPEYNAIAPPAA